MSKVPMRKIVHVSILEGSRGSWLHRDMAILECGHMGLVADPNQKKTHCSWCVEGKDIPVEAQQRFDALVKRLPWAKQEQIKQYRKENP